MTCVDMYEADSFLNNRIGQKWSTPTSCLLLDVLLQQYPDLLIGALQQVAAPLWSDVMTPEQHNTTSQQLTGEPRAATATRECCALAREWHASTARPADLLQMHFLRQMLRAGLHSTVVARKQGHRLMTNSQDHR